MTIPTLILALIVSFICAAIATHQVDAWLCDRQRRARAKRVELQDSRPQMRTENLQPRVPGEPHLSLDALASRSLLSLGPDQLGLVLVEQGGSLRLLSGLDRALDPAFPRSLARALWVRWRRVPGSSWVESWDVSAEERDRIIEALERRRVARIDPQASASVLA